MDSRAAITVGKPVDEVRRLWDDRSFRPEYIVETGAIVTYRKAPGDRGTEIHVELPRDEPLGKVGEAARKLLGAAPLAKVKDELRRFKQLVETGEIARSESTPEGERAERKLKQRPARPLEQHELEKAGV